MKNISVGFGNAFSGGQSATALGFARNGGGQAVLTSDDGKVTQCVFQAAFGSGQGQCRGLDGRNYVLVIS